MRNKRGFTLLEMVSVVIILGLLLLIGLPAISDSLTGAEKSVYNQHEKTLETTAKSYMSACLADNGQACSLPSAGRVAKLTLTDFVSLGMIRNGLENPEGKPKYCDGAGSFVLIKNNASGSNAYDLSYEICLSCSDYKSGYCQTYSEQPVCTTCEPPTCGAVASENTTWTNKPVTVGVKCIGSQVSCIRETFFEKVDASTQIANITIRDDAGKTATCPVNAYVDVVAPSVGIEITNQADSSEALDGWTRGATRVEMTSISDNLSGVNTWGMGVTKKADYNKLKVYEAKDGISAVYGYGKDNAGNEGGKDNAIEIKRDNEAPTIKGVYYGYQVYPGRADLSSLNVNRVQVNSRIQEYGVIYGVKVHFSSNPSGTQIGVFEDGVEANTLNFGAGYLEASIPFTGKTFEDMQISFTNGQENRVSRIEVLVMSQVGFYSNKNVNIYVDAIDILSTVRDYSFDNGASWQSKEGKEYSTNTNNIRIVVRDRAGNRTSFPAINLGNIDKVVPSCALVQSGTVGVNNWYRSNVTVSYSTRADNLSGVRDYAFHVSGEGSPKTQTQSADTNGTAYTGYVLDKAGNIGQCSTTVKRDTVKPSCGQSLSGSIGDNGWYVGTVRVTRSSQADDRSGLYQRGLSSSSTVNYNETTYIDHTADTASVSYYGFVKDQAGNEQVCTVNFKKDQTPPTCSISRTGTVGLNSWYTTNVGLTLNRSDALSGVASFGLAANTASYNNLGTGTQSAETTGITWRGIVKDNAGNYTNCTSEFKVDKTGPSCEVNFAGTTGENGWYRSAVTVGITRADNISGISQSGTSTSNPSAYGTTGQTQGNTAGTTWYGIAQNNAGLVTNCNKSVKVDSTAPTCSISRTGTVGLNSWYTTNVGLTLNRSDALSGVASFGLAANTASYNNLGTGTQSAETTGITWQGIVKDSAGNVGTCNTGSIKVDKSAPTCSIALARNATSTGWYTADVNLTINSSDALSGVRDYGLAESSPTYDSVATKTHSTDRTSTTWSGIVRDKAGNTGSCSSASFKFDKTQPVCGTITGQRTAWANTDLTVGVNCSDVTSGCTESNFTKTLTTSGQTESVSIVIKDKAGNTRTCTNTYNKYLDKTNPVCGSQTGGRSSWGNTNVSVGVNCSDAHSGCTQTNYTKELTGEGQTESVSITITDNVGNSSTCTNTYNKYIDKTAPTVTWTTSKNPVSGYSFYENPLTIYANCTDSGSGVSGTSSASYVLNSGNSQRKTFTCTDKVGNSNVSNSTYYSVRYYGRNSACGCAVRYSCPHSSCGGHWVYTHCDRCGTYNGCVANCETGAFSLEEGEFTVYGVTCNTGGGVGWVCLHGFWENESCPNSSCNCKTYSACWLPK